MSETRELRRKLEETQAELRRARKHLEKLRAHHAREQESLRQQLEDSRREVAELRGRFKEVEVGEEIPASWANVILPEPLVGERIEQATTALVALARNPFTVDGAMPALSRLLNLAPVDVRFRLTPMPPTVVARLPVAQAGELRAALRAEGFLAVSCPVSPRAKAGWITVKRFELEAQGMNAEGTQGESLRVSYAELRLLMRGRRISTHVEVEDEVEADHHPRNFQYRAHRKIEVKHERVENFLWVLSKGMRLVFTQASHFTGLGEGRAASVFENLQRLANELRRRAPHAVVDERFHQMPRFTLPQVDPSRSQELLTEVLFQVIEEGLWV